MALPKYLYKYRSFCPNHITASIDNKVWFAIGETFNDPFDYTEQFPAVIATRASLTRFVKARSMHVVQGMMKLNNVTEEQAIKQMVDDQLGRPDDIRGWQSVAKYTHVLFNRLIRTYSFSLSYCVKNQLLWAHYAEKHTGFCIRYDVEKLLSYIPEHYIRDITYDDTPLNMIDICLEPEQKQSIVDIIYTKSKDWGYENEYRIMLDKDVAQNREDSTRTIPHGDDAVDCIFFGLKAKEEDKVKLMEQLEGRGLLFKDMCRAGDSYELYPEDTKIKITA